MTVHRLSQRTYLLLVRIKKTVVKYAMTKCHSEGSPMIKFIIFIARIAWPEQFARIKLLVAEAEAMNLADGESRRLWVKRHANDIFISERMLNLIIELVVSGSQNAK